MAKSKTPSTKPTTKPSKRATESLPEDKADELSLRETVTVGDETLDGTPDRAATLLRGIATIASVRARLRQHGYNAAIHTRGWSLVTAANGITGDEEEWFDEDQDVSDAIAELDAADESTFRVAGAALKHAFPAQHAFLFADLKASRGPNAVSGMQVFVTRVDKLAAGKATKSPASDRAAVARLAERGIGPERRKQFAEWLKTAMSLSDDAGRSEFEAAEQAREAERRRALLELRAWFEEWAEITRDVVKRGDYLIRLGLAELKRPAPVAPSEEKK